MEGFKDYVNKAFKIKNKRLSINDCNITDIEMDKKILLEKLKNSIK